MTPLDLIYWALAVAASMIIVGFAGAFVQAMIQAARRSVTDNDA